MGNFHPNELPGEELIIKGLEDLAHGRESIESLLVSIGAPRLRRLQFSIPEPLYSEFPEERLYRFLQVREPDTAHETMNAYVRRLVSFEDALENIRA